MEQVSTEYTEMKKSGHFKLVRVIASMLISLSLRFSCSEQSFSYGERNGYRRWSRHRAAAEDHPTAVVVSVCPDSRVKEISADSGYASRKDQSSSFYRSTGGMYSGVCEGLDVDAALYV